MGTCSWAKDKKSEGWVHISKLGLPPGAVPHRRIWANGPAEVGFFVKKSTKQGVRHKLFVLHAT